MIEGAHTRDDFRTAARTFVLELTPNPNHATVIAMHGDLGAGKTTFVQDVAEVLGVVERVTSPTFVIQKKYPLPAARPPAGQGFSGQSFEWLVHIDAYRLEGAEDMCPLYWEETLSNTANLVFIEWAERVAEALPADAIHLSFSLADDDTRDVLYGKE